MSHLKPQDVLIALKLHLLRDKPRPKLLEIAQSLGISQAEVSHSLKRSAFAGLSRPEDGFPYAEALKEFLLHGLKYAFPARLGPMSMGIPTGSSASPMKEHVQSANSVVWPSENGKVLGQSVEPLYPSAPFAASQDPKLHELLSLIDGIRVGKARESAFAARELEKRLSK